LNELVNFDLSGWHEHERSRVSISWHNEAEELLSLSLVPIPWGTRMIFEREYWLDFARVSCLPRVASSLLIPMTSSPDLRCRSFANIRTEAVIHFGECCLFISEGSIA